MVRFRHFASRADKLPSTSYRHQPALAPLSVARSCNRDLISQLLLDTLGNPFLVLASAEARGQEVARAISAPLACMPRMPPDDAALRSECAGGRGLRSFHSFLCASRCEVRASFRTPRTLPETPVALGRQTCGRRHQETRSGKQSRRHSFEKPCSPNFVQMEGASSGKTFQSGLQLSMQLRSSAGPMLGYTLFLSGKWDLGGTTV